MLSFVGIEVSERLSDITITNALKSKLISRDRVPAHSSVGNVIDKIGIIWDILKAYPRIAASIVLQPLAVTSHPPHSSWPPQTNNDTRGHWSWRQILIDAVMRRERVQGIKQRWLTRE